MSLEQRCKRLAPRWFVVRNAHATSPPILMQPRYAMSILRGPMTRLEIRAARGVKDAPTPTAEAATPIATERGKSSVSDPWTSKGTGRALSSAN